MKNLSLKFNTGSLTNYGHKTFISLHEREALTIDRSLHEINRRTGCLGVKNDDWDLSLFIKDADTARSMAEKLIEIANYIDNNSVIMQKSEHYQPIENREDNDG